EAHHLGINTGPAPPGMFQFLHHHDAPTLPRHLPVATSLKWPARLLRLVVAPRQLGEQRVADHGDHRRARVGPPAHHPFLGAPPPCISSGACGWMPSTGSARAIKLAASYCMMVLFGPWALCRMDTWQVAMLGTWLSIQNGGSLDMPSVPQRARSMSSVSRS